MPSMGNKEEDAPFEGRVQAGPADVRREPHCLNPDPGRNYAQRLRRPSSRWRRERMAHSWVFL